MDEKLEGLDRLENAYVKNDGKNCKINVYVMNPLKSFAHLYSMPIVYSDVDPDFLDYINDVVTHEKAETYTLYFCVPENSTIDVSKAAIIKKRIHSCFVARYHKGLTQLKEEAIETMWLVLYGFLCMLFCMLIRHLLSGFPENTFFDSTREGLTVFGWVAMWCPFQKLLFDWLPLKRQLKIWKKLIGMKIELKKKDLNGAYPFDN